MVIRACPEGKHKQLGEVNSSSSLLGGFSLIPLLDYDSGYKIWWWGVSVAFCMFCLQDSFRTRTWYKKEMLYPLELLQFLQVVTDTKIVARVKWDTFVLCCVPANFLCGGCVGPASSCAILDASSRHYRWTCQWACSWGSYLSTQAGKGLKPDRSVSLGPPVYTLVSKIRSVGSRRSQYILVHPVGSLLLQLLGCRGDPQGWVKPAADQDEFLIPLPTEPTWELDIRRRRNCCRVLVSLEHSGNTAFICVSPPGCC